MQSLRRFFYSCLVLAMAVLSASADYPARGKVNFLIVSDLGDYGGGEQIPLAETLGEFAADFRPNAILNMGDTFHWWGVQSVDDPGWNSNFEAIYTAPALHNLWYSALGNHDYQGNSQALIDYTNKSRRWNLPARYYKQSFKRGDTSVDVLFIDSTPYLRRARTQPDVYPDACLQDTAAQSRWLAAQLDSCTADWVIVAAHHPVYSSRRDAAFQRADIQAHIEPILAANRPDIYLNGDVHCFEHFRSADGVTDYVTCTSGSNAYPVELGPDALFASGGSGFITFAIDHDTMTITMYDIKANPIYTYKKQKAK